jgi:hypothetical protein
MDKKLQNLIEKTLKTTSPLAEIGASHDTKFLNVLLGIYRVSLSTLRDIYYLSLNEETGASALDLTRKIIEYGVTIEYMIWKGKEKMADQFQEYMWVEVHHELEFLKSIGQDLKDQNEELKIGVSEAESKYTALNSDTKKNKSWAGKAVDKMIEELHTAGQLKDFDSSRIGQAYIWGCRLNHVSPFVVQKYMGPEEARVASDFYLRQAIVFGILFHLRLTTRYIDEIRILSGSNVHQEIVDGVILLYKELDDFIPEE